MCSEGTIDKSLTVEPSRIWYADAYGCKTKLEVISVWRHSCWCDVGYLLYVMSSCAKLVVVAFSSFVISCVEVGLHPCRALIYAY